MKLTDFELTCLIIMVEDDLFQTSNDAQAKVLETIREKLIYYKGE